MPSDPNEFLTCEEKGNVRAFDLRVKSSCPCDGCEQVMHWSYVWVKRCNLDMVVYKNNSATYFDVVHIE